MDFDLNLEWDLNMDLDLHEEHSQPEAVTNASSSNPKSSNKDLHRLIFEEGGMPDGTPLFYKYRGEIVREGYKKGRGIYCSHCNTVISPSRFEIHAGRADCRKPYDNIFDSDGVSLHEYSSHFKLCLVCKNDGDLLICDKCPRSFHIECISDTWAPLEKRLCSYCQESNHLGPISENAAVGTVSGINPSINVANRCVRINENPNNDVVACAICRSFEFSEDGFNDQTVIVCDQCELEFHVGCLREHCIANLEELPAGNWFCSVDCERLNIVIKLLVICGAKKIPDSLVNNITNHDLNWIIIHGKHASDENKILLAKVAEIFHNGFNPIVDLVTGEDFIEAMTYGLKINASDFSGVHCAILRKGSEVVTAGLFRVFGHEIVELSIVATSQPYRGKGYLKLFYTCFEKLVSYLNIKKFVVPAADDVKSMWINKFGFKKLTPLQQNEYRHKHTSMVAFSGTCLLEKVVPKVAITFEDISFLHS